MLWTFSYGSNTCFFFLFCFCFFYRQEDEKAESSPVKDKENEEADASLDDTHHHGNPLFQSSPAEAPWKTVEKKSQETKARNFGEGPLPRNPFFILCCYT